VDEGLGGGTGESDVALLYSREAEKVTVLGMLKWID
jgi:hypothetical protein